MTEIETIEARITTPTNDQAFGSDWNWADEAFDAWMREAQKAAIVIEDYDLAVDDHTQDAAVVTVEGVDYVLRTRRDGDELVVTPVER
jgi:hypothetical protein